MATYFRNVENDGVWGPGGTYTFEATYSYSRTAVVPDNDPDYYTWDFAVSTISFYTLVSLWPVFITLAEAVAWEPVFSIGGSFASPRLNWTSPTADQMLLYPTATHDFGTPWRKYTVAVPEDTPEGEYGISFSEFEATIKWNGYGEKYFSSGPTITNNEVLTITIATGPLYNYISPTKKFTARHTGAAEITVDNEEPVTDVEEHSFVTDLNTLHTYQWNDENERKVMVLGVRASEHRYRHQAAGPQRAGDTIWRPPLNL